MNRLSALSLPALLAGFVFEAAQAIETPFTPFKDGYANATQYNGTGKTLVVRAGDSKGWIAHALGDGSGTALLKGRLSIYVKDVIKDGTLRVYLATSLNLLENQTRFENLKSSDSVGSVVIAASKDVQGMVSIPLAPILVKRIKDGNFSGFIVEGADGLDVELGAIEGAHGALLYLDYATGAAKVDSMLADSVASLVVTKYGASLKGANGLKGDKGDAGPAGTVGSTGAAGAAGSAGTPGLTGAKGDKGDVGAVGLKGDKGDKGDAGASADQAPIFKLILDRGSRATFSFDRFSAATPRTTPDSSGNGNTLTFSTDGISRIENSPGDSAVQYLGYGYATAANSLSLNPYKEISLSAMVKMSTETPPDTQTIVAKAGQYEMAIINNKLRCRFKTVLADWAWMGDGNVPAGTGTAVSVKATYDGLAVRTFINGVQVYNQPFTNGPLALDSASLFVGSRAAGVQGFKGVLDQVKIQALALGAQDSLKNLAGRILPNQLPTGGYKYGSTIDSVDGLAAALQAKAPVNNAAFTGTISGNTDLVIGVTGNQFILHTRSGNGGDNLLIAPQSNGSDWKWNQAIVMNKATGNVGIGTWSKDPVAKLDVNGSLQASTVNGVRIYETGGNNGTVSCDTFCQNAANSWGSVHGAALLQRRNSDGAYFATSAIVGSGVTCTCAGQ